MIVAYTRFCEVDFSDVIFQRRFYTGSVDPAYDRKGFCLYRVTLPTGVMETVSIANAQRWTEIVQFLQEWCASD